MEKPVIPASASLSPLAACESKRPQRVRDRIFAAASALFYRQGIRNVGIDAIVCEANTNKMSLYRNFASKDELVVEYLREHQEEHWRWWQATLEANSDSPRRQIEALFAGIIARGLDRGCHGCPSANVAVELRGEAHPALQEVHAGRARVRQSLHELARSAGAANPEILGDTLGLLYEGCVMSMVTHAPDSWPGLNALHCVQQILDAHLPPEA